MADLFTPVIASINTFLQPYGTNVGGFEIILAVVAMLAFFARRIIFRALMTYIVYAIVFFVMARVVKPIALSLILTM